MAATIKGRAHYYGLRTTTFEGTGTPTSGTSGTAAGKATIGALYIDTSTGVVWRNEGTVASPVWSRAGKELVFNAVLGHNGAGAVTITGAEVGDTVVGVLNLTDLTDGAANFESTITVADQIQQSSASDLSAKKHQFILQR